MSDSSTSKTVTPSIAAPPTQSFADFKFTTIGHQPKLLERISAPDPSSEYIHVTPSPTPTPRLGNHVLPSVDAVHDLARPTLFQALATSARDEDGDVIMNNMSSPATAIAVRRDLGPKTQVAPLLLPTTESTLVQPPESDSASNLEENSTVNPSFASLWPTPAESRSTPSYSQDMSDAADMSTGSPPTLTEGPASSSSSLGLQYLPQDSHTPTPTATPHNIDEPERSTESPYTALRALQVRLQSSLSSLSPISSSSTSSSSSSSTTTAKSSPAQEALLLSQSAHTKSTSALSAAHHAHTLAQHALKSVQESLAAAQSCLAVAEEAKESAKEAMGAVERIKEEEEERNVWWRKEMLDGVQKDLEELGVWVGQREGEEAALRREKERRERAEKDREAVERAMNLHKNRNGNDKSVEGIVDRADEGVAGSKPRKQRKLDGGEREEEDAEDAEEVEVKMITMRKEEEAEQRAAEVEADLARRGWEGVASRGDSKRRSSEAATVPQASESLENESSDVPMDLDSSIFAPHSGSTPSTKSVLDPFEVSPTNEGLTKSAIMSAHEREKHAAASLKERSDAILATQKQHAEEIVIERREAERRFKDEEEMKARQKALEDQRALQERERLEKERAKALEIQEQERDAELRREQDKKRAEVMLQKQLANAATAARIRADRERESTIARDKDKQVPTSGSTANTAGPSIPTTPAKNSKKQSQKSPSGKVGNLVARQTLTAPTPAPEKRKPTSGNVKLSEKKNVPQGPKVTTLATPSSARQNVTALDQISAPLPVPAPGPSSSSSTHGSTTSTKHDHDRKLAAHQQSSNAGRHDAGPAAITHSASAAPNLNGFSVLENNPWVRRTESPLFRRISLPPIEHIPLENTASMSPSSASPSITLSLGRTGNDSGNLAMDTMSFPPTLSHDVQATNLRHILEPRGISWNPKRRPEDVKPKWEFDDEEDIPLVKALASSQKVKKEISAGLSPEAQVHKPQSKIYRQPTSSQTSTSSSSQTSLPQSSSPTKKVIPPPRRKLPPINFKKVQDPPPPTPEAQIPQPVPPARQKNVPIQPAAMSNDHSYSQPTPIIRTSPTLHERLSAGPSNGATADPDASAFYANEARNERFSPSPPGPLPEIIGDGGWGGPSHDGYADSPRWSEPADNNNNYHSPSPEPYHRRGDHYSPPSPLPVPRGPRSQRRVDSDVYIHPPTHARQSPIPPRSLSPPPQLGRKRPRESDWEADRSNTRRRENNAYNPRDDRRASPPPRTLDTRRPHKESIPERRDVSRGSRGDSYRPAYASSSRVEDNAPNDYSPPRHENAPSMPEQWHNDSFSFSQEYQQNANPPQKPLLARFSDPHPPAPSRNHKKSNDRSQAPPRGPNKQRGGQRGQHAPLANRLTSATLLKRMT